jgi:hypothetical protein
VTYSGQPGLTSVKTAADNTIVLTCNSTCISHSNGPNTMAIPLGQTYLDCAPLGTPGVASTYSLQMATEAALAWPLGNGLGGPTQTTCADGSLAIVFTETVRMPFPNGTNGIVDVPMVWVYTGPLAGHVRWDLVDAQAAVDAGLPIQVVCPTIEDPTWN